jgi:hypothetical protein
LIPLPDPSGIAKEGANLPINVHRRLATRDQLHKTVNNSWREAFLVEHLPQEVAVHPIVGLLKV